MAILEGDILSGGTSLLLMAGNRQVISHISKGSRNILIYNFIITTFDCQGGGISVRTFALAHPGVTPPLDILCIQNCCFYLQLF